MQFARITTLEDHIQGWRKVREDTVTGRSGLTFAHFKANALDDELALLDATMVAIPYETGLSPLR
jgi:hypothetical protein